MRFGFLEAVNGRKNVARIPLVLLSKMPTNKFVNVIFLMFPPMGKGEKKLQ